MRQDNKILLYASITNVTATSAAAEPDAFCSSTPLLTAMCVYNAFVAQALVYISRLIWYTNYLTTYATSATAVHITQLYRVTVYYAVL
jgi:hypothetical protein